MKFLKETGASFTVAAMLILLGIGVFKVGAFEYRQWFTIQTMDITAKVLRAPRNDERPCRDHPQDWGGCFGGKEDGDWLAGIRLHGGSYTFRHCNVVGDGYGWHLVPNKSGPQCTVNGEPFPYAGGKG